MAMNEYIQSAIQTIVHKAINDAPFDKTRTGIVKAINNNNTYKVLIDGVEYPNVPIWHGLMANTNDVVKIKFPSGNVSQMYICEARVESQSLIGEIKAYAGQVIPNGWLECNGAEILKSDYAMLYNAIGDVWGTASDANHFVLPNLCGKVAVGYDENDTDFDAIGDSGGYKGAWNHNHTQASHAHYPSGGSSWYFSVAKALSTDSVARRHNGTAGDYWCMTASSTNDIGEAHVTDTKTPTINSNGSATYGAPASDVDKANMPPYAVVKYIIYIGESN